MPSWFTRDVVRQVRAVGRNRLGTDIRHVRGPFGCQSVERLEQAGARIEICVPAGSLEGFLEERKQILRNVALSDVGHSVPRVPQVIN